jgi:hypothetical protein
VVVAAAVEEEVALVAECRSRRAGSRVRAKALSPLATVVAVPVVAEEVVVVALAPPIHLPNSRAVLKVSQFFFAHEEHPRSPGAVAALVKSASVCQRSPAAAVAEVAAAAGEEDSAVARSLLRGIIWSR